MRLASNLTPIIGLAACLLAACALPAQDDMAASHRPRALLDAYLIAHGMATSYAESPNANPAVVEQLRRLDLRAQKSLQALGARGDMDATANAVAALTDYAARQSDTANQ